MPRDLPVWLLSRRAGGLPERTRDSRPAEIATLCDRSVIPGAANALRFQCLHGLGHGLTANAEHDIFRALRLCDALEGDWDRGSCYSGVFMENIIFATHQVEAARVRRHTITATVTRPTSTLAIRSTLATWLTSATSANVS